MKSSLSAAEIIRLLELKPHPEGGHYRETFRDDCQIGGRAASTAIYFLLGPGERSRWHRIDAAEVWHHYAGGPLALHLADAGGTRTRTIRLGSDLPSGERPQAVVPAGAWQAAEAFGEWALLGCTVAPGFEFAQFEVAPADWSPR
jgi:predicted cupin superfamily sugar epimerase